MLSGDGGKVSANIVVYVCYITLGVGMYFGCRLCCSRGCIHECGIRIWFAGGWGDVSSNPHLFLS